MKRLTNFISTTFNKRTPDAPLPQGTKVDIVQSLNESNQPILHITAHGRPEEIIHQAISVEYAMDYCEKQRLTPIWINLLQFN